MALRRGLAWLTSLCALAGPVIAFAQTPDDSTAAPIAQLAPVVITATRIEALPFDVPASIDRIGSESIRDGHAEVNISESLSAVPGLLARDRQNYAQDVQLSIRGFGARSTFGIRGVRLYVDGIPATFPDGQGQITNVDLGSVARIEVLRGPFSALYGNSSGGVIQVFTEDGAARPTFDFNLNGGSDGELRVGTKLSGSSGSLGYMIGASHFETRGYREHSAAERNIGNVKLTYRLDEASTLTVIGNSVALPHAEDPLGLSRAQFDADPRSVDAAAIAFDTRKHVNQSQGGIVWERRLDAADSVRILVYDGHRNTQQFQSIPVAPQANPLHPGGVIALGSDYRGTDLRWSRRASLGDRPFTLVTGLAYDTVDQHRQGYQNFTGPAADPALGVQGALRRDELDKASNLDEYLQASLQATTDWSLSAGVRHSSVRVRSGDRYVVGVNGDDSGAAHYDAVLPVLGVLYVVNSNVHVYATAGRGFETPTLNELAYRSDGSAGLNFSLRPSHNTSGELGVKAQLPGFGEMTAAVFDTRTSDEIVTLSNVGGRSTYQNATATRRTGLEMGWSATFADNLRAQAALTTLAATYSDDFLSCSSSPCPVSGRTRVAAGNRIPGVANRSLYAALAWAPPAGWRGGIEGRALSKVYVNDANADAAAGFFVASAHVGYVARFGPWKITGFVRSDNLFARKYAGSVIVNEGNGRFFEPAAGRTWLASVSSTLSF